MTPSSDAPAPGGSLELGLAASGTLRWGAADLTGVVEEARQRLDLSPVAAAALGRTLTGAALLLRLAAKAPPESVRLVVEIRGDGPIRTVLAEADAAGNLRGMVGNPRIDLPATPAGKLAVGEAVGRGFLSVIREHPAGAHQSHVELVSGEIGADLAHYLRQSEQTRSAVLLGVLAKPEGIAGAGGIIVEALPGVSGTVLAAIERNLAAAEAVSRLVEAGGLAGLLDVVLAGLDREVVEQRELRYHCRCRRERLQQHLAVVAPEELASLQGEDGAIEAECAFCGVLYRFAPSELAAGSAIH